jgi:hypothetical protein
MSLRSVGLLYYFTAFLQQSIYRNLMCNYAAQGSQSANGSEPFPHKWSQYLIYDIHFPAYRNLYTHLKKVNGFSVYSSLVTVDNNKAYWHLYWCRGDSTTVVYISSVHSGPWISSTLHGFAFFVLLWHVLKFYFQDKPHVQQDFLFCSEYDLRQLVVSKSTVTKKNVLPETFLCFNFSIKLLFHDML